MTVYIYVTGATEALEVITEEFQTNKYLHWIGFGTDSMKDNLYSDLISSFRDLFTMNLLRRRYNGKGLCELDVDTPTHGQQYASFFDETVYCAPLYG